VFLDRDGVLNSTDGYVNSPDDLDRQLLPRSLEALARLSRQSRVPIVLVTNQGGIDEGHMTDGQARAILERLTLRVQEAGGRLDAVYYCPIRA
jgi:D-glycero-D-manno-heptose 1,7-bisphosphate phosphatase